MLRLVNPRFDVQLRSAPLGEPTPAVHLIVFYEDLACGMRTMATVQKLTQELPFDATFDLKCWRFDVLEDVERRDAVRRVAFRADILLIGAQGAQELPLELKQCLWEWIERREGRPCAVGLVLDPEGRREEAAQQMVQMLRTLAESGQVDLLHDFAAETADELDETAMRMIPWHPGTSPSRTPAMAFSGINE